MAESRRLIVAGASLAVERGEAVALALHLLRLTLGPDAAEAAARAAGA